MRGVIKENTGKTSTLPDHDPSTTNAHPFLLDVYSLLLVLYLLTYMTEYLYYNSKFRNYFTKKNRND